MAVTAILRRVRCLSGRSLLATVARVAVLVAIGLLIVTQLPPTSSPSSPNPLRKGRGSGNGGNQAEFSQDGKQRANTGSDGSNRPEAAQAASDDEKWTYPIQLQLDLSEKYAKSPVLQDDTAMFRQYGFNLRRSNELSLSRELPDVRHPDCKAIIYPQDMPKVSVIIIYYNEPVSTLLRNVLSVLNRSPPELLGEIVLVDDNSTLPELEELPKHLAKLPKKVCLHVPVYPPHSLVRARFWLAGLRG